MYNELKQKQKRNKKMKDKTYLEPHSTAFASLNSKQVFLMMTESSPLEY